MRRRKAEFSVLITYPLCADYQLMAGAHYLLWYYKDLAPLRELLIVFVVARFV